MKIDSGVIFDYFKCPINKHTFKVNDIREWVETVCEGYTLNLFAGFIKLNINEFRNDLDKSALADTNKDALKFIYEYQGKKFDTILLDPPYSFRKSMEFYNGNMRSPFKALKDNIVPLLNKNGLVITFGYHSNTMGKLRGFVQERIALFSHGGATHDTIASVERFIGK